MMNSTLRKFYKTLRQVKVYQNQMAGLSDEELSGLTVQFKARLRNGETLDDILPEAFAAICEADSRILGKYPYDVQIVGGIALHKGYLAEMNTGEGKTLTATLPLYLNALTGKSTLLVTTNDYLALRDADEMGPVYRFMGLTVAKGVSVAGEEPFTNDKKKKIYEADIVYTTHGTLGFDYLLNNLVNSVEDRFLRELYYIIIDEADSVLLDGAQTPLVISGSSRVQSNYYQMADFFVTTLIEDRDYEIEEKCVWLTEKGVKYAERFFGIDNYYAEENFEINRHVTLALRAHKLFEKGKDYMIEDDNQLVLLDQASGRRMHGVKLRGGQQQALEVKEGLSDSPETRSIASITYQNLFLLFEKMSGMSGTLADAKKELIDVYAKNVVVIPPNRPLQRIDYPDLYFKNAKEQIHAAIKKALQVHETGQPVLIVAFTIQQTEVISAMLLENGIPHNVLNANNAFWEAAIIREAGQPNAVTVATSMAGRGTDIKLGEGVKDLGGLAVIGIGRMDNVRQERQARGRSGRQGDEGFSQFFVSLEDETVLNSGIAGLDKYLEKDKRISKHKLIKLIDGAQRQSEENAVSARKQAVNYDQVLKKQRDLMYTMRNNLLDGETLDEARFMEIVRENIHEYLKTQKTFDKRKVDRYILDNLTYSLGNEGFELDWSNKKTIGEYLMKRAVSQFREQEKLLQSKNRTEEFLRRAAFSALDDAWVEQVDYLQQLQSAVTGRNSAQRNPVYEYQKEALESFEKMERSILNNLMRKVLLSNVYSDAQGNLRILYP